MVAAEHKISTISYADALIASQHAVEMGAPTLFKSKYETVRWALINWTVFRFVAN